MTPKRWAVFGVVTVVLIAAAVAVGAYAADRLRTDVAAPTFAAGEGPNYFPEPDGLSDDMTSSNHDPGVDDDGNVTDISANYDWQPRPIGGGGWVRGMEVHSTGSLAIARTDVGGAYRFDREQERWIQLITEDAVDVTQVDDYQVESVAMSDADPNRIYLAAGRSNNGFNETRGRVFVSLDGGDSWTTTEQGFEIHGNGPQRDGGERMAASPLDADDVWLGTTDGLWRSTDGGSTFERVESAPRGDSDFEARRGVEWVLVEPGVVYVGVSGAGVYESTDDGASWQQLWSNAQRPYDAEIDDNGILWAVDKQEGNVRRYDPATGEFERIDQVSGSDLRGLAVHPEGQLIVILTEHDDMWRSTDGGTSWERKSVRFSCPGIPWLDSFDFDLFTASSPEFDPVEPDRMWMPQGFAVWSMPDVLSGSPEFICRTTGIEELVVNDIVVTESDVVVAASWDRPVFHLPPGGESAAKVGPTDRISGGWDVATTPADPNFLVTIVGDIRFCCEDDGQAYTSVFSTDGGRNWDPLPSFETGDHPETLRFGNVAINSGDTSNIVWLPSWDGAVHYSKDAGATWTPVLLPGTEEMFDELGVYTGGSHFQYYLQREVLLADPFVADRFYLFHGEFGLYRSDNGGESWKVVSADGLPTGWTVGYFNAQLSAVPDRPGHLLYTPGTLFEGFFPLYESVDSGESWAVVPNTADVVAVGFGAPVGGSSDPTIYMYGAVDGTTGYFRTTDLMDSWEYMGSSAGGLYRVVHTIAGDPAIPGRVYVGLNGTSVVQGDER